MARPTLHSTDAILDSAMKLLLEEGAASATIEAIAGASGAPTGSIYHRFGSRDAMLARLWIRAVRRSQEDFLAACAAEDPREAALGAARSMIEFCRRHPADARLLVSFRREDLMQATDDDEVKADLKDLNRPVEKAIVLLTRRLFGSAHRRNLDRTLLATFDLPYGAARRYLIMGAALPRHLEADVDAAVKAVIDLQPPAAGSR
jgi:AcrR family transcriptional regulator